MLRTPTSEYLRLRDAGLTIAEIAADTGVTRRWVLNHLARAGVANRPRTFWLDDDDESRIKAMA